jgi:type IX secretion system PorP/SprF family membrane protein
MISYAYRHSFKKASLSFGLGGGIMQRAVDGSKLVSPEGNYEPGVINHEDDFIPASLSSGITGDLNAGIFFQTKKAYAGISAANLIESSIKLQGQRQESELKNPRHYTAIAGYSFRISKKLYLIPNVSVHTDFVNVQPEVNAILQFKDNIYGGVSFRGSAPDAKDALVLMLGFKILKNLRVGYSYDFSLSALNAANNGSHEVYVQYGIKIKDLVTPGKIIYNPRFL